jgi:hypothetical protein
MEWLKRRIGLVSLLLIFPALCLSAAGLLQALWGVDAPNQLLDAILSVGAFKAMRSPVVVLGGTLAAFALNAWRVIHLSADVVNEEFVVALSIKRLPVRLFCLGLAAGLILLLGGYGFVENFRIVAR